MAARIALIDYDDGLLQSSKLVLRDRGYEVRTASDGLAGFQLLEEMRPDIVVMELVLPKLHGLQLCARIRKHPDLQTKVVVAASSTYPVDLRKAREGDFCPECDGILRSHRGIEVGHVFYLGDKYSKAMKGKRHFKDEAG